MTTSKTFHFNAAHRIQDYDGVCRNVHGHNYKCIINLKADEWKTKWMWTDFKKMSVIGQWLDNEIDHSFVYEAGDHVGAYLNTQWLKTYELSWPPSTEFLAAHIFQKTFQMGFPVHSVELRETPKCRAVYFWE